MSDWSKQYNHIVWHNGSSPNINESNLNANQEWLRELKDRTADLFVRTSVEKQEEIERLAAQTAINAANADADAKDAERFANLASNTVSSAITLVADANVALANANARVDELTPIYNSIQASVDALVAEVGAFNLEIDRLYADEEVDN